MSSTNQALGPNAPVPAPDSPSTAAADALTLHRRVSTVGAVHCPFQPTGRPPVAPRRLERHPVADELASDPWPTPRTRVTCTFTFEAAHRLAWHPGKCRNLHGHSYRLDVTVAGPLDANGVVLDFDSLQDVVRSTGHRRLGPPGPQRDPRQPDGRAAGPAGLGAPHRRRAGPGRAAPVGDDATRRWTWPPARWPPDRCAGHLVVLSGGLDSTVCMALAAGRPGSAAAGPHLRLRAAPPYRAGPGGRGGRALPVGAPGRRSSTPRRGAARP